MTCIDFQEYTAMSKYISKLVLNGMFLVFCLASISSLLLSSLSFSSIFYFFVIIFISY